MAIDLSRFLSRTGPVKAPGDWDEPTSTRLDSGFYLDWQGLNKALGKNLLINKGDPNTPNFVVDGSGIGNSYGQLQKLLDPYLNAPESTYTQVPVNLVSSAPPPQVPVNLVSQTAVSAPPPTSVSHLWGDVDIDAVNKMLPSDWRIFSPNDITAEQRTPTSKQLPSGISYAAFRNTPLGWDLSYIFAGPDHLKEYLANPSGMALPSSNYLADFSKGNPVEVNPNLLDEDLIQNKFNDAPLREQPGYGKSWGLGWNDGTVEGITQWLANGARDQKGKQSPADVIEQAKAAITYQLKKQAVDTATTKTASIQTDPAKTTTAASTGTYGGVYKTNQPYDKSYWGTDANYYKPGQPGYNAYGNMPGFYYNPTNGAFVGSQSYGAMLDLPDQGQGSELFGNGMSLSGLYWVPWAVAPQELKDKYGNDPKNIVYKAAGETGAVPGKIDVSVGDTLPKKEDGSLDIDATLKQYGDKGVLGTGLSGWDIVNGGLGTLLGKVTGTGKPADPTIIDRMLPRNDNPAGPFSDSLPSGRRDYGTDIPRVDTGTRIDVILNNYFPGRGRRTSQPGGTGGTGGGTGDHGGDIGGRGPGGDVGDPRLGPGGTNPDTAGDPNGMGKLDVTGELTSLDQVLKQYFLPEYGRLQGSEQDREKALTDMINGGVDESGREKLLSDAIGARPDLEKYARDYMSGLDQGRPDFASREKAIMDAIGAPTNFSRIRDELSTVARGVADELFAPGGQFDNATSAAAEESVNTGFGTTSGGFQRARQNILAGGRDVVSRSIAQNAAALAPLALEERGQNINALLQNESILSPLEVQMYGQNVGARGDIFKTLAGGATDIYNTGVNARASQLATMASTDTQNRLSSLSALGDLTKSQMDRLENLRESLFTGQSTIEQLRLARETQAMNKTLIDKAIASNKTDWLGGIKDIVGIAAGGAAAYKTLKSLFS